MSFISWNVRGLNIPKKRCLIKSQLDLVKWDIGFLQKTKLSLQNSGLVFSSWKKWKFFSCLTVGASRGLALLWNYFVVDVNMVAFEPNWMLSLVSHRASSFKVWVFNIYAPLGILAKYDLQQVLMLSWMFLKNQGGLFQTRSQWRILMHSFLTCLFFTTNLIMVFLHGLI